jgi:glycogen debranching enzyme
MQISQTPYYGTVDATPLSLILLTEYVNVDRIFRDDMFTDQQSSGLEPKYGPKTLKEP